MSHCLIVNRWWACICFCLYTAIAHSETYIPADNDQYLYTGRIDFSDAKAPLLSWPGTSIKANFTGERLEVVLDDQNGKNYFNVIVDGNDRFPYVLEAKQGEHRYLISSALSKGKHSVEIYKRTEGEEGATQFKGLWLADGSHILKASKRPKRRIEIYGDSITSGMGNEGPDNGADHLGSDKNNYLAYGAITARNLNAELHTISQSGIGVMVSWFPFIMPQFYDQLSAVGNNDSVWDFNTWTPHVVVINLMQNDSWLIDREKRLQPTPSKTEIISSYKHFVSGIRKQYPEAYIVCALGSMDATQNDTWPSYVRTAVAELRAKGDRQIDAFFFEFTGYGQHPRVAQHQSNADKLTQFIRKKMHW